MFNTYFPPLSREKILGIKATVETGKNIPLTHSPNGIKKHFLDVDKINKTFCLHLKTG